MKFFSKKDTLPTKNNDIVYLYYIRFFAIVLIVNSHFNTKHLQNFEPFLFYGLLGNWGNIIFFFISSYILTKGFYKYEKKIGPWIIYRILYLSTILVGVKFIFSVYLGNIENPIIIFSKLFLNLGFIGSMMYLSIAFPFLYKARKLWRILLISGICLAVLFLNAIFSDEFNKFLLYVLSFLLGMSISKDEVKFPFNTFIMSFLVFFFCLSLFFVGKVSTGISQSMINIIKILSTCYMLFFLKHLDVKIRAKNFVVIKLMNESVKQIAKLSLYIYITHFYFIELAYSLSSFFALPVIFAMLVPVCYIEYAIFNPIINKYKQIII